MLSNKSKLTVQVGEKTFEFLCDQDSPLGLVHDALSQMRKFVIDTMTSIQEKEVSPKVKEDQPKGE
jgi:hypothetical protein